MSWEEQVFTHMFTDRYNLEIVHLHVCEFCHVIQRGKHVMRVYSASIGRWYGHTFFKFDILWNSGTVSFLQPQSS